MIPEDAIRAANASTDGSVSKLDEVAACLEFTASQLQPGLAQLGEALGVPVDAVGFALGMLAATFAIQGLDVIQCARIAPVQFAEFLTRCGAMEGRVVCEVKCGAFPSVTCGLDRDHDGRHAAGRLRW